ncbi:hypothetical protein QVD17_42340 [Tagetes erecta]|uniref:Uncharacterized protein n=1 Tax=Tagetes erecta TaxID=13708 RepID=A0AAD8JKA3_TARER|nr:hypothetical protein QVD17_42340 [Tagetes erecta]
MKDLSSLSKEAFEQLFQLPPNPPQEPRAAQGLDSTKRFFLSRHFARFISFCRSSFSRPHVHDYYSCKTRKVLKHISSSSCRLCQSEVHTADQLPLPRYGLDAPPARAGLSDGYDRTIEMSRIVSLYTKSRHAWDFRTRLPRVLNISLAARSEPERISDRLEDPVSNAPLAFNSQGELSASSLVPRGEGPSNSEVGSQYTDTPGEALNPSLFLRTISPWVVGKVVDSERMILCEEEVVTIIKNQIPLQLGNKVPSESLLRLLLELFSLKKIKAASAFRSALWLLAIKSEVTFGRGETSTWDNLSLGYDLNSTFKKEPDQANQEIGSDEGERELLLKEGESLLLVAIKCNLTYMLLSPCFITPITADEAKDIDYLFRRTKNKIKAANSPASVGGRNGQIHTYILFLLSPIKLPFLNLSSYLSYLF